jgi:hypothetical protein
VCRSNKKNIFSPQIKDDRAALRVAKGSKNDLRTGLSQSQKGAFLSLCLCLPKKSNKNLVGGAITILKNDGLRPWVSDDIPYMKWKIKAMFQTTNQEFSLDFFQTIPGYDSGKVILWIYGFPNIPTINGLR